MVVVLMEQMLLLFKIEESKSRRVEESKRYSIQFGTVAMRKKEIPQIIYFVNFFPPSFPLLLLIQFPVHDVPPL